jgi:RHS repeat-associated protein
MPTINSTAAMRCPCSPTSRNHCSMPGFATSCAYCGRGATSSSPRTEPYIRDGITGLDHARNRFYSSTLGRFTTADPLLSSVGLGNPLSWNRYAYVNGDPVNITDPSGLCSGGENMPNDSSCLVSAGDEGSNSPNIAPDPNGVATDSNGDTVGVQVEGTSVTVSATPDPVNPYDASIPTATQNTGIQGPVGTGGAADAPNNGPPNQNACTAPILNAVNNNYGTNF